MLCLSWLCSDGEDELYYNLLLEEEPGHKLQVSNGLLCLGVACCLLCTF
jgi:hypothetical protein